MATPDAAGTTRTEHDTFGPIEVPAGRLWGAQTQRSLEHFRISNEKMPDALIHALLLVKRDGRSRQRGARPHARRDRERHRHCGRRGARGPSCRRVPARRLADRVRHADQHERQRGARQPRVGDSGRLARRGTSRAPERRRQPQPVVERRVPDGDERRGCRRGDARPAAAALRALAATLDAKGDGVRRISSRSAALICRTRRR